MTDLTLKEAAEALGLTKNTVKGRLKDRPDLTYKDSAGLIRVTETGMNWLRESVMSCAGPSLGTEEPDNNRYETGYESAQTALIELLKNQLTQKDKQIESLQNQLENVTAALRSAQALHAMEKQEQQQLPDPEHRPWWHFWK